MQDGGNRAGVGGEAALEDDDGLRVLEGGELPFELHVEVHGPGNRAHRAGSDAEAASGLQRSLAQPWMRRQPEVVVRREIDDRLVVERRPRALLLVEDAQAAIESLLLEAVQIVGQKLQRIGGA